MSKKTIKVNERIIEVEDITYKVEVDEICLSKYIYIISGSNYYNEIPFEHENVLFEFANYIKKDPPIIDIDKFREKDRL